MRPLETAARAAADSILAHPAACRLVPEEREALHAGIVETLAGQPSAARADAPPGAAELEDIVGAIRAAWDQSFTPPELRAACISFCADHPGLVDLFRYVTAVTVGVWIKDLLEQGHDRAVLVQVAAAEMQRTIAGVMRAEKERSGQPFVPARQAIVAYFMADTVAKAEPFRFDLDAAVDAWRAHQEAEQTASKETV